MGKYYGYYEQAKRKIAQAHEASFITHYNNFLTFYTKADMKLDLAVKLLCEAYPQVAVVNNQGALLDNILEKFKNEMMLEMKYQEKMKDFVAYYQMYLDIEHSKMSEDGNTKEARAVIKDWLRSTPGMEELLNPKHDMSVKINSDNKTVNNQLSYNPRLRLTDLPAKWQELALDMKDKKLLEQKKDINVVDIKEFEEVDE